MGLILKLKVKSINIYTFGGITILDEDLNMSIYKEILLIIGGPLMQLIFFLLVYLLYNNGYVSNNVYSKFYNINILLFSFNLLPILPLDGGKLLNNILDLIFSYNMSHYISIIISLIFSVCIFYIDNRLLMILLYIFILYKIYEEYKSHDYRYNKLILERKLKHYIFNKYNVISDIKNINRNKNFYIIVNNIKVYEYDYY